MSFLLASLAVVALLAFVVYALDEPPPDLIDLSDLDDGELLPAVIVARDRAKDDADRLRKLLKEAATRFTAAESRVETLEAAVRAPAEGASQTYVAEVSTSVVMRQADTSVPDDGQGGTGSPMAASPR